MIEPLDRSRRDSTLFQFTTKQLRDFIDPNHLLIRIDERLDFAKLMEPLEECYCPDFGRPAIHPEVMVRALLICSLYNIASFRGLCSAISENLAYRWFCFLTIDDPVFDHSSVSHFIDRIGRDGFGAVFDGLNDELLCMGLLSPEMYVGSSLVKANVNSHDLSPSGITVEEFKEQAVQVNGLFVIAEATVDADGVKHEETRYFQKPDGRLPLSPVDTDARWRTRRTSSLTLGDFILPRGVTHASKGERKAVPTLLERGCPCNPCRWLGTPVTTSASSASFWNNGTSRPTFPSIPSRKGTWSPEAGLCITAITWCVRKARSCVGARHTVGTAQSVLRTPKDCQACPAKDTCLPPGQNAATSALRCITPSS